MSSAASATPPANHYHLLDGIGCPNNANDYVNSNKKIGALFVRADGFTQYVDRKSPDDLVLNLFSKSKSKIDLWRELRPLMDTNETSFHLHIKYANETPGGGGSPQREYVLDPSAASPSPSFASTRSTLEPNVQTQLGASPPSEGHHGTLHTDVQAITASRPGAVQWISIRTSFVSALIENDTVLFFHAENPIFTAFLEEFLNLIPNVPGRFDFFVLDSLLAATMKILKTHVQGLKPVVYGITQRGVVGADPTLLSPVNRTVRRAYTATRSMNLVLKTLVMGPMYNFAPQEMRDILQSWHKAGQEVTSDSDNLMNEIDEAREQFNDSMDQARNKYLLLEVLMNIVTVAFSFGACVSGIFGMNLASTLETKDSPYYFVAAVLAIVLGMVVIINFGIWYLLRNRPTNKSPKYPKFSKGNTTDESLLLQLLSESNQEENRVVHSSFATPLGSCAASRNEESSNHITSRTLEVLEKYRSARGLGMGNEDDTPTKQPEKKPTSSTLSGVTLLSEAQAGNGKDAQPALGGESSSAQVVPHRPVCAIQQQINTHPRPSSTQLQPQQQHPQGGGLTPSRSCSLGREESSDGSNCPLISQDTLTVSLLQDTRAADQRGAPIGRSNSNKKKKKRGSAHSTAAAAAGASGEPFSHKDEHHEEDKGSGAENQLASLSGAKDKHGRMPTPCKNITHQNESRAEQKLPGMLVGESLGSRNSHDSGVGVADAERDDTRRGGRGSEHAPMISETHPLPPARGQQLERRGRPPNESERSVLSGAHDRGFVGQHGTVQQRGGGGLLGGAHSSKRVSSERKSTGEDEHHTTEGRGLRRDRSWYAVGGDHDNSGALDRDKGDHLAATMDLERGGGAVPGALERDDQSDRGDTTKAREQRDEELV